MERINRKKLIIIIFLLVAIVTELIAIGLSKANKTIQVQMNVADNSKVLSSVNYQISAIDDGAGYYITLPETINSNIVSKYYVTNSTNTSTGNSVSSNNDATNISNNTTSTTETVEKKPGDLLYLTSSEVDSKIISISADYDKKISGTTTLYNKILTKQVNTVALSIKGYMPIDSTIGLDDISSKNTDIENTAKATYDASLSLLDSYKFKILINNSEVYNPKTYSETLTASFANLSTSMTSEIANVTENSGKYTVTVIQDAIIQTGSISIGNISSFDNMYAILQLPSTSKKVLMRAMLATSSTQVSTWDGTTASGFAFGSGTSSDPYLITSGSELSYLANQVNNGNTYSGKYFELITDIDLNGNEWTPIGNLDNSFAGIFDGSGRTIGDGTITISSIPSYDLVPYGVFGSIQGDSIYSQIKNVVFDGINIAITASGTTSSSSYYDRGYYIGTVCGIMNQKSKISNIIVKNSTISANNNIRIRNSSFRFAVGGIVGGVRNSSYSTSDPGDGSRYDLENCYSDVDIDLSKVYSYTSSRQYYMSQCQTGGVIGTIQGQPIWPKLCIYKGSINANGLIGPTFGGLIYTSDLSGITNVYSLSSVWNGNEGSSNLQSTCYYTNYSVNGTTFGSGTSVTSGTSSKYISSTISNYYLYGVEGVNKGLYASDLSTFVNTLNSNIENVRWEYANNDLILIPRFTTTTSETTTKNKYQLNVSDRYNTGTYTCKWYNNGTQDTSSTTTTYSVPISYTTDQNITVLTYDGHYHSLYIFQVPRLEIHLVFNTNTSAKLVTASLAGTALSYINQADYTYQWYKYDIAGKQVEQISGASTLSLTNLEDGQDYELIATNNSISQLSTTGIYTFGNRIAVYVNYSSGNNSNDGLTPETAVQTMATGYNLLNSSWGVKNNVIVLMNDYSDNNYIYQMSSSNQTRFSKNATITGCYRGTDYGARLYFEGSPDANNGSGGRFLYADTTFQYLTFYANTSSSGIGVTNLYSQGYSLTIGEQVYEDRYASTSNTNALVDNVNSPNFHLFGGFSNNNDTNLTANNGTMTIKSGCFARVVAGSRNTKVNTGCNNTTGTSTNSFNMNIVVDIKNSTKGSYKYDINLLVCGQTDGNIYANMTLNIKNGYIGRMSGGSIGFNRTMTNFSSNSYYGSSKINILGGQVDEMFGGSLGRNQSDVYYYGNIEINISGGTLNNKLYGVGAGGVTGYNDNSTDPYKYLGKGYETKVTINISGGDIEGNIYGAGYGYSSYLTQSQIADDGGTLYGNSYINISGGTINGNIYGAGKGYTGYYGKTELAQMYGDTNITITGNPSITGSIYGAGEGITETSNTARVTGNTNINVNTNTSINIYGAGNIGKLTGTSNVYLNSGTQSNDIYGGGNVGDMDGTSNVYIKSGDIASNVYGGGASADATNTNVYLQGGTVTNIYGGSNVSGTVSNSKVTIEQGTATNIYGGNNYGGTTTTTEIDINGGSITYVYGGGNQATSETTNVNLNAGNIGDAYGGGNQATVTTTNINHNGSTVNNIYGGGNKAGATTTNVNLNKGTVGSAFGGSNNSGDVDNSNVTTSNVTGTTTSGLKMEVTYTAEKDTWRNVSGYPTYADITVKYTNNLSTAISTWNSYVDVPNSKIYSNYSNSDITENNGEYTLNQKNRYYGVNTIAANGGTYTLSFGIVCANDVSNITVGYGIVGNDTSGKSTSYSSSNSLNAKNIYGGNNAGGTAKNPTVNIAGGTIENVFGGGNQIAVTKTNLNISDGTVNAAYAGGNAAGVSTNTNLNITGGTIKTNAYGGGNDGTVTGNTSTRMSAGTLLGSIYGGGNGVTATVNGNTNITIDGTATIGDINSKAPESGCAFAGGKAASTGTTSNNNSISTINVVGGTIHGNVYGGANTAVVYGTTNVNIGYDTVGDTSLNKSNIDITGTVFGGGEANASGSETYDFSFISVTKGINININGNGYTTLKIEGSIFGSGNASSTSGNSYINLKNYGQVDSPKKNVSIQRATTVTLDNSAVALDGAKDRTNEYSNVFFSISRVDLLKLKNNSTLYLNYGANLLKGFSSLVDISGNEVKAKASIDDSGNTVSNVTNRLYMYEGKNLNIATNEQITAYGEINGMTFMGMFTNTFNPATSTGLYNHEYSNGSTITNSGTFTSNAYVLGQHKTNHDTKVDGFYTTKSINGIAKEEYIGVTPDNDLYYMWLVGEKLDVTTYEIALTASKYATLGTYELPLTGFSTANSKYIISGFSAGLKDGITLVNKSNIPSIAGSSDIANSQFGLSMRSGKAGWQNNSETDFYTSDGGSYNGSIDYNAENSSTTPTLEFCFYHSQNLTLEQTLGNVKIRFQVLIPIDDLNYKISYIDINITMTTAIYQDDYFEQAIAPGEEFGLFTSTETQITNDGVFSTYDSLYIPDFKTNKRYSSYTSDKRCIVSRDSTNTAKPFKANTRITMLDMVTNTSYYYIVTSNDQSSGKYQYYLKDFLKMGSTNEYYDESKAYNNYYDTTQDLLYEKYIFHVDFGNSNITTDSQNSSLLMELQSSDNQTLIGVLGIERDTNKYSLYTNQNAVIKVSATTSKDTVYLKDSFYLNVTTEFKQNVLNSKTVYDTKYFDNQMGIKITWLDANGNQLNSDSLLGINIMLNGEKYYPRIDGTIRINIAEKVSNILSKILVDTSENTTLATGKYKIRIESFKSPDGIYYGLTSSDSIEKEVYIINGAYGLKVSTDDNCKIIKKATGKNLNENNALIAKLNYSSGLENPKVVVSLERRDYSSIYSQNYTTVDLADYVTNLLTTFDSSKKEYLLSTAPNDGTMYFFYTKSGIKTGTYKLDFKLYDGNTYIGQVYEYFIVD